jgi:hypothetical protein
MSAHKSRGLLLAAVFALAGCGRTPDQICEDFAKQCDSLDSVGDCEARAATLEQEANTKQCLQLWDAYVGCVDDLHSLCSAAQDCQGARDDLATYCGIHFE